MPVFKSGKGLAPAWCEMEYFEIINLTKGRSHVFARSGEKEKLFIGQGQCRIAFADQSVNANKGDVFELSSTHGQFQILETYSGDTTLIHLYGRWGNDTGGCGVFTLDNSDHPQNIGDPVDYLRTTNFDNHYHDCDEYWIIFVGKGLAVSEGKFYEIGSGDCVATGMGYHHDFPRVFETIRGVYFETTLERQKRLGHLWNHTHGPAEPKRERI
jgi:mannose-6-phosphate isomerase-like protein (cupin superfamily)